MRNHPVLPLAFACILLLAACGGGSPLEKLNGKWQCDVNATMALMEQSTPEWTEELGSFMQELLSSTMVEFDVKEQRLFVEAGDVEGGGTFALESESGESIVLRLEDGTLLTLEFRGNDSIFYDEGSNFYDKLIFTRAP